MPTSTEARLREAEARIRYLAGILDLLLRNQYRIASELENTGIDRAGLFSILSGEPLTGFSTIARKE